MDEKVCQIPVIQRPSYWGRSLAFLGAVGANVLIFYGLAAVRSEPSPESVHETEAAHVLTIDPPRTESSPPEVPESSPQLPVLLTWEVPMSAVSPTRPTSLPLPPRLPVANRDISADLPGLPVALPRPSDLMAIPGAPLSVTEGPLSPSRVDRIPLKIAGMPPHYPSWARRARLEGMVTLRFIVTEEGKVENIEVHDSEGDERFGREATRAIAAWRFEPAMSNGKAVAYWYFQKVYFKLIP